MDKIMMTPKEFLEEHKHLDKVLMSGSKKEQVKEAKSQKKEVKKYTLAGKFNKLIK